MTSPEIDNLSILAQFRDTIPFPLDQFQIDGCEAIASGKGVLVSAPTGSGKTIVGEFAVYLAVNSGGRCFYTTPIKALSNQKYHDLSAIYGPENVGLLTGDVSINRDADIVVMTTEVLRNMIYADSDALHRLTHVVLDEVHYLADPSRGPVWEEVILNLDEAVSIVALSATVSNVEEFGRWLTTVRGDTAVVLWEHRPVPLNQYMMVGERIVPLFESSRGRKNRHKKGVDTPNAPDAVDAVDAVSAVDTAGTLDTAGTVDNRATKPDQKGNAQQPTATEASDERINPRLLAMCERAEISAHGRRKRANRPRVISALHSAGMLPAIIFIFSRAGCDGALAQCYTDRVHLTSRDEAREILSIIDEETADIPQEDLDLMGFRRWRVTLSRGVAAHHAGMLPAFRHIVEKLFTRGLLKVVFATETLALGINMPARTVVLESLVKFNGETHADLTPAQYTQLTGRAGRRGIDVLGNAVVLWQPSMDPRAVAGLASTRTYPLVSTFRPGYNMTVNLLNTLGLPGAHAVLERSFAQFQANGDVVERASELRAAKKRVREVRAQQEQLLEGRPAEEVREYLELRRQLSAEEKRARKDRADERQREITKFLRTLQVGDVIALPEGRNPPLAVCTRASDTARPHPALVVEDGRRGELHADELSNTPQLVGHMKLPRDVGRHPKRAVGYIRSEFRHGHYDRPQSLRVKARVRTPQSVEKLKLAVREHPVHHWPGRETLVRLEDELRKAQSQTTSLAEQDDTLVNTFDRMLELLAEMDYVQVSAESADQASASAAEASGVGALQANNEALADGAEDREAAALKKYALTDEGERLALIHNESDLLIAQCLRRGVWNDLDPAELAAVVSTCVFENRKATGGDLEVPTKPLAKAIENTERIWDELITDEQRHHLPQTRPIEPELATAMHQWTAGAPLAYCLQAAAVSGTTLTPGDFVRWCRQVIDVLNQIRSTGYTSEIRDHAFQAINAIRRGVVALGS